MPPENGPTTASTGQFEVTLSNFTGPFDLLLSLITRHRLDITEVALAEVTDEFISYIGGLEEWDLSRASEFLVVAATLLDLKAARLLPRGDVESEEDLELLEARDLLFARLLAYKAFKEVGDHLAERMLAAGRGFPRSVPLEPRFAALLPELVMTLGPDGFAALAARALEPKPGAPAVDLGHLHDSGVSVRAEARTVMVRLHRHRVLTFRSIVDDAASTAVVVARFLCLLDLFREGAVAFDQTEALGELQVRWTGGDAEYSVGEEFDEADTAISGERSAPTPDETSHHE